MIGRYLLALFLLLSTTHAKANDIVMAQRSDLIGIWSSIEINNQFQPKLLPSSPWPLKCQWFAFYADGRYATYMKTEESGGNCGGDPKTLAEFFEKLPPTMFFKWVASKEQRDNQGQTTVSIIRGNNSPTLAQLHDWSSRLARLYTPVQGKFVVRY